MTFNVSVSGDSAGHSSIKQATQHADSLVVAGPTEALINIFILVKVWHD